MTRMARGAAAVVLSAALCLCPCAVPSAASAATVGGSAATVGGSAATVDGSADTTLSLVEGSIAQISFTAPSDISFTLDPATGRLTADDVRIANNSAVPIAVSGFSVSCDPDDQEASADPDPITQGAGDPAAQGAADPGAIANSGAGTANGQSAAATAAGGSETILNPLSRAEFEDDIPDPPNSYWLSVAPRGGTPVSFTESQTGLSGEWDILPASADNGTDGVLTLTFEGAMKNITFGSSDAPKLATVTWVFSTATNGSLEGSARSAGLNGSGSLDDAADGGSAGGLSDEGASGGSLQDEVALPELTLTDDPAARVYAVLVDHVDSGSGAASGASGAAGAGAAEGAGSEASSEASSASGSGSPAGMLDMIFIRTSDEDIAGKAYRGQPIRRVFHVSETRDYSWASAAADVRAPGWSYGCEDGVYERVASVSFASKVRPASTALWFYGMDACESFDLANLDVSDATHMEMMFAGCGSVRELDLTGFSTGRVVDMAQMLDSCGALEVVRIGEGWDTGEVRDMSMMFSECESLSLDCRAWDVGNVSFHVGFNTGLEGSILAPAW